MNVVFEDIVKIFWLIGADHSVTIKSEREIELMREAGRILATVHNRTCKGLIRPGITK